jgi:hypothetical protein
MLPGFLQRFFLMDPVDIFGVMNGIILSGQGKNGTVK